VSPIDELRPATTAAHSTALWRARSMSIRVGEEWTTLRLMRFDRGWLASADTLEGPTLGLDPSPYLAARRALEPLGIDLIAAMTAVGTITEA
jgi:hypothetical protein